MYIIRAVLDCGIGEYFRGLSLRSGGILSRVIFCGSCTYALTIVLLKHVIIDLLCVDVLSDEM